MDTSDVTTENHIHEPEKPLDESDLTVILDRTLDFIKTCENKVAIVLSIYGVILAVLFSSENITLLKSTIKTALQNNSCGDILFLLGLIFSILPLLNGIYLLISVLFVNINCPDYHPNSRIFFGHIAKNESYEEYQQKILHCTKKEHYADLASQIYINATICTIKFKKYELGLKRSLIGFFMFIFMWLMSHTIY